MNVIPVLDLFPNDAPAESKPSEGSSSSETISEQFLPLLLQMVAAGLAIPPAPQVEEKQCSSLEPSPAGLGIGVSVITEVLETHSQNTTATAVLGNAVSWQTKETTVGLGAMLQGRVGLGLRAPAGTIPSQTNEIASATIANQDGIGEVLKEFGSFRESVPLQSLPPEIQQQGENAEQSVGLTKTGIQSSESIKPQIPIAEFVKTHISPDESTKTQVQSIRLAKPLILPVEQTLSLAQPTESTEPQLKPVDFAKPQVLVANVSPEDKPNPETLPTAAKAEEAPAVQLLFKRTPALVEQATPANAEKVIEPVVQPAIRPVDDSLVKNNPLDVTQGTEQREKPIIQNVIPQSKPVEEALVAERIELPTEQRVIPQSKPMEESLVAERIELPIIQNVIPQPKPMEEALVAERIELSTEQRVAKALVKEPASETKEPVVLDAIKAAATLAEQQSPQAGRQFADNKEDGPHQKSAPKSDAIPQIPLKHAASEPFVSMVEKSTGPKFAMTDQLKNMVIDQIIDSVRVQMHQGKSEMHVRLNPESLGEVTVHMTMEEGVVQAEIRVQTPVVKNLLETNLPQLREQLAARGMDVNRVNIVAETNGSLQNTPGQQSAKQRQQAEKRFATGDRAEEEAESGRILGYNTMELTI